MAVRNINVYTQGHHLSIANDLWRNFPEPNTRLRWHQVQFFTYIIRDYSISCRILILPFLCLLLRYVAPGARPLVHIRLTVRSHLFSLDLQLFSFSHPVSHSISLCIYDISLQKCLQRSKGFTLQPMYGIIQPFTEHPVHCEYLGCPKTLILQCEIYQRELS